MGDRSAKVEALCPTHRVIPFHHKSDTFGDKEDKGDKGDKEEDLYQEFCEMVNSESSEYDCKSSSFANSSSTSRLET
ncbi:MAG: hypothetical protein C4323_05365 [Mastigocladus sp. ERB_26_2]